MAALHPNLRKKLEKAVVKARDTAEKAAKSALQSLAVDNHQPFDHMSPEQRQLRVKLRARGRAIGDRIDAKGKQELWHLIREAAYEHWHRMLFARFLAENNLLMHPDGVAVTLDECEELAAEEGLDKWELASRYAAKMLPAIFRPDDPVLQIEFAPEDKLELERLLTDLESEVFDADDSLGWVYQFWQSKKKGEVNRSGKKIGADELPAVTQLFTEDYMVKFLLHNSLGAWWAGKFLAANPKIVQNKELTEDDLRNAVGFDDYEFEYLRFIFDEDNKTWKPAAGCFEGWPKEAKDITILDPCCGSGHFLVAVFELMVQIRLAEEGLSAKEAVEGVLKDNLFGLEIDARCTQIAVFALAFTAWKFPKAEGFRELPQLNIACSGVPVTAKKEDWLKLANGDEKLKNGMDRLWTLFRQAPVLGSLIDPTIGDRHELIEASFDDIQPLLEKATESEKTKTNFELTEAAIAAKGIAQAAEILAGQFTLVATNVPYLGRGQQCTLLMDFADGHHIDSKADLATMFVERMIAQLEPSGTVVVVTPQNWLFLNRYKKLRKKLLTRQRWNFIARLGPKAFQTPMWDFNVMLLVLSAEATEEKHQIAGIDVSGAHKVSEKATLLAGESSPNHEVEQADSSVSLVSQFEQITNLNAVISVNPIGKAELLADHASALSGVSTGAIDQFIRKFWEVPIISDEWEFLQSSVGEAQTFGGRSKILFFEKEKGTLFHYAQSVKHLNHAAQNWLRGKPNWGKHGVCLNKMGSLYATIYNGDVYDENCNAIIPNDQSILTALWCFCSSIDYHDRVREQNQSLMVQTKYLIKVPFDLTHWQKVAAEKYPHGLPKPFSSDPTQWLFNGQPQETDQPLHVAVVRLLGYQWPRQTGSSFPDCPAIDPDGLEILVDDDGIVCIPAVRGEQPAADRLRSVLVAAIGDEWSPAKETELLSSVDGKKGLDDWLRNKYFIQHCKFFGNRPFIWHIWDGERDGFAALVNYHKLDKKLLETLTYSYLGDWINKQKADSEAGVGPAETKMLAALVLQKKLQLILRGEKPYDIFVRWKPFHEQSIGWDPDLNDGVRMNIRPFFEGDILRKKPNIKWKKDRGKEPTRPKEQYPWFWDGSEFAGERVNDVHLSLQEKQEAREKAAKETVNK